MPLVVDVAFSDHCCIYFDVSAFPVQRNSSRLLKRRIINDNTIESFQKSVNEMSLSTISSTGDLVDNFNSKIQSIFDKIAPHKTKYVKKLKATWRNGVNIRNLKRKCCQAEQQWRKKQDFRFTMTFIRIN